MREVLTDLLDALALLLIAAGLGYQATGWTTAALVGARGLSTALIGVGLFTSGLIVLGGSWLAARPTRGDGR
jgi:hypothetical protein